MGKTKCSPAQRASRRTNWMINKFKQAKQAYHDNVNKRQKKEYNPND